VVGLTGFILILLAAFILVGVTVNLEGKKALIEEIATKALNRQVSIDGKIRLKTSLKPVLTIEKMRIGNPADFQSGDFARLDSTRIRMEAGALLSGKLNFSDLRIDGLHLLLEKNKDGEGNWLFSQPSDKPVSSNLLIINMISMKQISVSNPDLAPISVQEIKAKLSIQKDKSILNDLQIVMGETELVGKISIDKTALRPKVDIELKSPQFHINDFNYAGSKPLQEASQSQDNSTTGEAGKDQAGAEEPLAAPEKTGPAEKNIQLMVAELLGAFDARLNLSGEKVLSGKDTLGSGQLKLELKDGRISIDPLQLNPPDGLLMLKMSLESGPEASALSIHAKVENFDFGILARRYDPQTDIGGIINVDVDLKTPAKNLADFLANETGHIDFSIYPENWRSGVIDFWLVDLIAGIATAADKEQSPVVECLIGRWSLEDGLLKPDIFVVDTSHMRICGKGTVNFNENVLDLKVTTTPKQPEFLRFAAPIGVSGTFSDIRLGLASMGLTETGMKFLISPLSSSLQIMLKDSIPEDGSDVCGMSLGAENRPTSPPAGCR